MKRVIVIPTILAVVAVLGVFPVAFATHSNPFNGSLSGSFTLPTPNSAILTGTSNFEHLGKTTLAGTAHGTGPAACKGGFTAKEQDTLTAANGDDVFISSIDVACPTSDPNTFQFTSSFTITGGTGRFTDASGSGTGQFSAVSTSAHAGTLSGTLTGTITY